MFKILKILVVVLILGGGAYYFLNYDKENKENNSIIKSAKEFSKDLKKGAQKKLDSSKNFQKLIK